MYSLTMSMIVFIFGNACADDSFVNKYSMISDIDNYQNQTIGSFVSKNDVQCGVACALTHACVAFFFSKTAQQCVLQDTSVEMEVDHDRSLDYKYWRKSLGDTKTKLMRERPPDYTFNGPREESCYKFVRTPKSFEDASLACQNEGSHLVHVETQEENDLILEIFDSDIELRSITSYWTGGIKDGEVWRWGVGGSVVLKNILPRIGNINHEVLKFYYRYDGSHYLMTCGDSYTYAFICEFELLVEN